MSEQPTPRRALVPGPPTSEQKINTALKAQMAQEAQRGANGPLPAPRPMEPIKVGNIAKAIADVMASVGTIKKGGHNKFHNYDYARMEDLLVAVTPLMGKAGLAVIQNECERNIVEGNRLAVTYEFSIFHASNEVWPEKPRFTGMALARDSKGNWDDKAINKCHTNARKYFLLALFQVPAGDFEDADADSTIDLPSERVPGPPPKEAKKTAPPKETAKQEGAPAREAAPAERSKVPHRIILGPGGGVDKWVEEYIKCLAMAETKEALEEWDKLNDGSLQVLSEKFAPLYDKVGIATQRRFDELERKSAPPPGENDGAPAREAGPEGEPDTQEIMNAIAQNLLECQTYEEAEAYWNQQVVPNRDKFDEVDWELLMKEWQRTETRLSARDDAMDQENPQ